LSGLAVHLASARLLASQSGADDRVVAMLGDAQRLTRDGMSNARSAVAALRGDELPNPRMLPALLERTRLIGGATIDYSVVGPETELAPEVGLAVYRTAQESLTNVVKYAGRGARVFMVLQYHSAEVHLSVRDERGCEISPPMVELPKGGHGLVGLAERAATLGGRLIAAPTDSGWTVDLSVPYARTPVAADGPLTNAAQ
jgi:signal transduction histidine kinase